MREIRLEDDEILARNQREYLNSIDEILKESKNFKDQLKLDELKCDKDKIYYRQD